MKACIYLRQSLDRNNDAKAITRQREDCQRMCRERGWEVVRIIEENDTSASVGVRPGFEQLVDAMKSGEFDVVVAWHVDRLLRKMTDLERVIEVSERTGVRVATVSGDLDLSTDMGRMVGRLLAAVARGEVERKSTRHRRANQQKAEAGLPHASRRPYGYEVKYAAIRPSEATVLREMAGRIVSGWSCKDVAYWLNEQGYTTTEGKAWYPLTVRNMLMKERYVGIRTYKGQRYPATWEPIFTKDEWETLQLTLKLRREASGSKVQGRKYLLTGIAICGVCGLPMNGSIKKDRPGSPARRTYLCRVQGNTQRRGGCGKVRRNADALDAFVREAVLQRTDAPYLESAVESSFDAEWSLQALVRKRDVIQSKIAALVDDYADGTLTKADYTRARERVSVSLADVERQINDIHRARLPISLKPGETVREAWESNGVSWRRALIELMVELVVVKPSPKKPFMVVDGVWMRFDPEAIEIVWR